MKLLSRLFGHSAEAKSAPESIPPAPLRATYVVGDIHGSNRSLTELLEKIALDFKRRDLDGVDLVLVGDYVDRGEESRATLEHLWQMKHDWPEDVTCLMGNHERMMLDFLMNPRETGRRWLRNGGLQTLASFGVGGLSETSDGDTLEIARNALDAALPVGLKDWLASLPLIWISGNVAVVHAAADPTLPIDAQVERTLLWGHEAFGRIARQDGIWVVHGHTIVPTPQANACVISVDTGAYFTGCLTAAVLIPGQDIDFLQSV